MTGHIGTNTPKFVPPRWDDRALTLLNGAVQIRVGLELAEKNSKNWGLGIVFPDASSQSTKTRQLRPTLLIYKIWGVQKRTLRAQRLKNFNLA